MTAAAPRSSRLARMAVSGAPILALLAGCGGGAAAQNPPAPATRQASSPPAVVSSPSVAPHGSRPGVVAVTTSGALVKLDPNSGAILTTLVGSGVLGDEISVSPDGSTVYYAAGKGCHPQVKSISSGGGSAPVS